MAKGTIGPYGYPSGKIGNVVFYMLKGKPISRSIGKPGKPSVKQLGNRQAMAVTMKFVKPLAEFIKLSFKKEVEGTVMNAHNLATSYIKKQALTGEYPNIKVDYAKVELSHGQLEMAKDLQITKGENGLNLSWNTSIDENGNVDDFLMVAVAHPTKKKASCFLNAAKRADGSCFIPLDQEWMMTEQMEVYVCLKSANETLISDSTYVGNLNGAPETEKQKAEKDHYHSVKARFDQVAANYQLKRLDYAGGVLEPKAFRHLEREYQVLREKLLHLPGKPS